MKAQKLFTLSLLLLAPAGLSAQKDAPKYVAKLSASLASISESIIKKANEKAKKENEKKEPTQEEIRSIKDALKQLNTVLPKLKDSKDSNLQQKVVDFLDDTDVRKKSIFEATPSMNKALNLLIGGLDNKEQRLAVYTHKDFKELLDDLVYAANNVKVATIDQLDEINGAIKILNDLIIPKLKMSKDSDLQDQVIDFVDEANIDKKRWSRARPTMSAALDMLKGGLKGKDKLAVYTHDKFKGLMHDLYRAAQQAA